MTAFQFRPATRVNVGILVGLSGPSGGGKTMSAMRMAQGIVGRDGRFAVVDTEKGRALHYAPQEGQEPDFVSTFRFDHAELNAPFHPASYSEAIQAADAADYRVIVVDSMSHEWAGDGGILDWQEMELDRMAGDDWKKREACKMAAWIKPKMAHKHMMQKLLQVRAHLILCFRAEPKIEMIREGGKTVIVPKQSLTGIEGYIPVTEKNLPFELTASFLVTSDAPGMPKPIKLQEQHRAMFPLDKPINEESGRRILEWASGGLTPSVITSDAHTIAIQAAKTLDELKTVFAAAQVDARVARDAGRLARYVQLKEERKTALENPPDEQIATQ